MKRPMPQARLQKKAKHSMAIVAVFFCGTVALGAVLSGFGSAKNNSGSSAKTISATETVWVMKPDGGKQCENESGQPLDSGAQQLSDAGITVLGSKKTNDGKIRAQMCGIPSGTSNSYQISRDDLPKALRLGFKRAES